MKVYTCTDFKGHWPVGVSAVITANNKTEAVLLLSDALLSCGLDPRDGFTLEEISLNEPMAHILQDGDY